ncbi:hypothetical protein GCM10018783_00990 [Streptomyces griseosporeus]|nr:hypothetical protein GCM10018783_00990 [Streptomyces griseosporeus]
MVVTGTASVVTDPAEHQRLVRAGPRSWVPSVQELFIQVSSELVTGRELVGGRSPYGLDRS